MAALKHCLILLFFMFIPEFKVYGQVCSVSESYKEQYPVNITYSEWQMYKDPKCRFFCKKKSRRVYSYKTTILTRTAYKTKEICCNGFYDYEDVDYNFDIVLNYPRTINGNSITCYPKCQNACTPGRCVGPNECECVNGYENRYGKCYPVCTPSCSHGTCVKPNQCRCDQGYQSIENGSCVPDCPQGCEHGTCVAPNNCSCDKGYKISSFSNCVPDCPQGCEHGTCAGPDNCVCHSGFKNSPTGACIPDCPQGCEHGTCVAPGNCSCDPGYKHLSDVSCTPDCGECEHGVCIAPGECVCVPGYQITHNNNICHPQCKFECGNGTCSQPNVCTCLKGYYIDLDKFIGEQITGPLCIPKCENCEGKCVAPNNCICDSPYQAKNVSVNGGACDCFDCNDGSIICKRTICVLDILSTTETYSYDVTSEPNDAVFTSVSLISTSELTSVKIQDTGITDRTDRISTFQEPSMSDIDLSTVDIIYATEKSTHMSKIINLKEKSTPSWIYIAIGVMVVLTLTTTLIITFRKRFLEYFTRARGSYVVEEEKKENYDLPEIHFAGISQQEPM